SKRKASCSSAGGSTCASTAGRRKHDRSMSTSGHQGRRAVVVALGSRLPSRYPSRCRGGNQLLCPSTVNRRPSINPIRRMSRLSLQQALIARWTGDTNEQDVSWIGTRGGGRAGGV